MEDSKRDNQTLDRLIERLSATLGHRRYEAWFASQAEFRIAAGGELHVMVGTPIERDYLQRQFADEVGDAYAAVCGADRPVSFRIDEAIQRPTEETLTGKGPRRTEPRATTFESASSPTPSPLSQIIVGESNHSAITIAKQIAAGVFTASPLVLWGPTGVGKSQLLRAIHDQARRTRRTNSVCLTAEDFLSGFVQAVRGTGLPSFRSKHRGANLLLLDDVQMLLGKTKTLEELQYTLDSLVNAGAQVVMASDRGPAELSGISGELASRLAAGVAVEVRQPDVPMRRELLKRIAAERNVEFETSAALDTVASGVVGGARELSGVVNRLRYQTGLFGDTVDEKLARQAIDEVNRQSMPRVKMADVQDAVCRVFGVEASLIKSDKRTKAASEPRMLAMWLARKYTRNAWSEIGDFFGNRRHSTVISACNRVEKLLTNESHVRLDGSACSVQEALRRVESELRTA